MVTNGFIQEDFHFHIRFCFPLFLTCWLLINSFITKHISKFLTSWCWSLLYSAILRSRADSLHSSHVTLNEGLRLFTACFEYPPKWCSCSAVCFLQGWRHSKLLPSRRVLCTPCTTSRHFMQSHIGRVHAGLAVCKANPMPPAKPNQAHLFLLLLLVLHGFSLQFLLLRCDGHLKRFLNTNIWYGQINDKYSETLLRQGLMAISSGV